MERSRFEGGMPWRAFVSAMSLLVFCGAAAGQYTERTFNISGKFTPEQAKWYAVEFEAQKTTVRC